MASRIIATSTKNGFTDYRHFNQNPCNSILSLYLSAFHFFVVTLQTNSTNGMKTGNLFKILLLIIFATTFVACESEEKDGGWESMKWETNVSNINKNKIEVPNEGGVYVIKCTNNKSFLD